jgi:hypothetical protein
LLLTIHGDERIRAARRAYPASMASGLSRPWLERPAPTHPLLTQLADSKAMIGVQGPEEVLRVVLGAYRGLARIRAGMNAKAKRAVGLLLG